jgi:hypothetical protein
MSKKVKENRIKGYGSRVTENQRQRDVKRRVKENWTISRCLT